MEDEPDLNGLLVEVLREAGFEARGFLKAGHFLFATRGRVPDLVILDLNLPDADGLEVARALREDPRTRGAKILMLTARASEEDAVEGLRWADDYVRKPFSLRELLARVRALLRRDEPPSLAWGELRAVGGEVFYEGRALELTPAERAVLLGLMRARGEVVPRARLLDAFGGKNPKSLDVIVARLRRKLGRPELIKSEKGRGYRLCGTP